MAGGSLRVIQLRALFEPEGGPTAQRRVAKGLRGRAETEDNAKRQAHSRPVTIGVLEE
jgi:hypothetical protein